MKISCLLVVLLAGSLIDPARVRAQDIDWSRLIATPGLAHTLTQENGATVLTASYTSPNPKKENTAILIAPCRIPPGHAGDGVSFDVRGDGSANWASIILVYPRHVYAPSDPLAHDDDIISGYEAIFPLDATGWKTITLRWRDFTQNYLPWNPSNVNDPTTPQLDPAKVTRIVFGEGRYFTLHDAVKFNFALRNFHVVDRIPAPVAPAFSPGWSHARTVLGHGGAYKILLLGDSITDFGGDRSYGYFLGQKITQTWGNPVQVANCGIRGHSVRGGLIILPRSLRTMPDPDLVCVLYGANDSTALGLKKEFNQAVFQAELEQLIDRVRLGTNGKADICLLSGVPRHVTKTFTSAGIIEQIVGGVKLAAQEKQTAYVDTFSAYLRMPVAQQQLDYRDNVHQLTPGQQFMGGLVFDQLQAAMKTAP